MKLQFRVVLLLLLFYGCDNKKQSDSLASGSLPVKKQQPKKTTKKTILFFGNSLTAGFGLSPDKAFPALIQIKIDSLNLNYKVVNAGLSGETSTGGDSRISWVLKQNVDVFVLELGANDGLRGISPDETYESLVNIIKKVKTKNPKVKILLTGMEAPPNMGEKYTKKFRQIYKRISEEQNITLLPFLLTKVAGIPALNQDDGIHPTEEGHKIVANNVWDKLKTLLI